VSGADVISWETPVSRDVLERNSDAREVPRRIALIRRETSARVLEDQDEVVPTAPHLLVREILLFQICVVVLALLSLRFDAPLEAIADPSHTPNPAKAPWYFLGLQELLHYFPPVVAGVLLPGLVVLGIVVIPFARTNLVAVGLYQKKWKKKLLWISILVGLVSATMLFYGVWPVLIPTVALYLALALPALPGCPKYLRKRLGRILLADWIMTWFVLMATILTLIGVAFRGPGWEWTWPWRDGIY
jgi:quinol-cytochrome oxidoreductase complex cytochrome b subunit